MKRSPLIATMVLAGVCALAAQETKQAPPSGVAAEAKQEIGRAHV